MPLVLPVARPEYVQVMYLLLSKSCSRLDHLELCTLQVCVLLGASYVLNLLWLGVMLAGCYVLGHPVVM